jgi:hypothetical protein
MQIECAFCGDPFERSSANHKFCSVACRDRFNGVRKPLNQIPWLDCLIFDGTDWWSGRGFYGVLNDLNHFLSEEQRYSRLDAGSVLNIIFRGIEEFGSQFEPEDLKRLEEAELACERLARRAQRYAALVKQARQRADVLMKVECAEQRSKGNVVNLRSGR